MCSSSNCIKLSIDISNINASQLMVNDLFELKYSVKTCLMSFVEKDQIILITSQTLLIYK